MSGLTIVTYHYVRHLAASPFPRLAALDAPRFARQLDHFAARHRVIAIGDVLAALDGGPALPEGACLLTFDDGYRDHAEIVTPALAARGWSGLFFPAADAVTQRRLLEVNRIQFVLAAVEDRAALRNELDTLIAERSGGDVPPVAERIAHWLKPGRWDDADTHYVKRVLQQGLPATQRSELTAVLFARHVTADEVAFADELYLDRSAMAAMRDAGMAFGSHGARHERLPTLDDTTLDDDLNRALDFLADAGVDLTDGWTLCYPHGAWDARVRDRAAALGCRLAVTIEPRIADLAADDPLALPRLDTNDLPS